MTFASPVAMKPTGAKGGESVVFGQVKEGANNPTLLPAGFLAALGLDGGEVPPRDAVRLTRGKPAGLPLQDAAPERARRRGHALHRPHLRGHRHARVRGPGRRTARRSPTRSSSRRARRSRSGRARSTRPHSARCWAGWTRRSPPGATRSRARRRRRRRRPRRPRSPRPTRTRRRRSRSSRSHRPTRPRTRRSPRRSSGPARPTAASPRRPGRATTAHTRRPRRRSQRGEQAVAGSLEALQAAGYKIAA